MRIFVLRPEPGNAATCAAVRAAGVEAVAMPLFAIAPLAWTVPDAAGFDALLLTSANAVRHAGAGLRALSALPAVVVGEATAAAARAAGLGVAGIGGGDARAALTELARLGFSRALHLCGHDHLLAAGGPIAAVVPVYASAATGAVAGLRAGDTAMVHSPRAARRLAELVRARAGIRVAAISAAAAAALGTGWAAVAVAARPDDAALVAAALAHLPARLH